jgi:hypothetical protein
MSKASSIVGWICVGLVSALTLFSAVMEFVPVTDPAMLAMVAKLGVGDIAYALGIAKFIIVALYLIPRTATVGFVLMIGYYGGALATNITHGFTVPEYAPILVAFVLMTVDAYLRKPELLWRLKGKAVVA